MAGQRKLRGLTLGNDKRCLSEERDTTGTQRPERAVGLCREAAKDHTQGFSPGLLAPKTCPESGVQGVELVPAC